VVGAIVLTFLVGVSVGVLIGRRVPRPEPAERPAPAPPAAPRARRDPPAVAPVAVPNKRARKVGLTEDSFRPSDDILEKLRLAAEGQLDPAVLASEPEPPAPEPVPAEQAGPPPVDPALAEAEQRILDRLRREAQGEEPSDFS
jgi:hypothetical protein